MIPQDVHIQNAIRFWTDELSREIKRDLRLTSGLLKSMAANAYDLDGERDDSGLYHAAILAQERVDDLHGRTEDLVAGALESMLSLLSRYPSDT